jgi:hypothetical protein
VRLLPPVRLAQFAPAALCTRGAGRCAVRSCAAMVPAAAGAQWASLVSPLPELLAVASLVSAELQEEPESQPGLLEAAQLADALLVQQAQLVVL